MRRGVDAKKRTYTAEYIHTWAIYFICQRKPSGRCASFIIVSSRVSPDRWRLALMFRRSSGRWLRRCHCGRRSPLARAFVQISCSVRPFPIACHIA